MTAGAGRPLLCLRRRPAGGVPQRLVVAGERVRLPAQHKPMAHWDRYFHIIQETDPYRHLGRSTTATADEYDHRKPWVDHVSIQNADVRQTDEWREEYRKPMVFDEVQYEGNIVQAWGCISAREMVHRFWHGMPAATSATARPTPTRGHALVGEGRRAARRIAGRASASCAT